MKKIIVIFSCLIGCTVFAAHGNAIYIYADQGVSKESLTQTLHTMHSLLDKRYAIKTIKADAVIDGNWRNDAALFIMPGGADLPYVKALRGRGNSQIKFYVENGGSYLGICAGGYYAGQKVVFAPGTPLEVIGPRELAFFPGTVSGPALAPYSYDSNKGARAARLKLSDGAAYVFYNGGGEFVAEPMPKNITVVARYQNLAPQSAAIVKVKIGKGIAVLTGVHIEYDPKLMNNTDAYLAPIIAKLSQHNSERQQLLALILNQLEIQ